MDYKFLIDAITEELAKAPSAQLLKERGRLRMLNGDKEGAMEDIRQALATDPTLMNDIEGEYKL